MKKQIIILALSIVCIVAIILSILKNKNETAYEQTDYAMGTVIQFHLYGEPKEAKTVATQCMKRLNEIEKKLSYHLSDTTISKINSRTSNEVLIDEEIANWIKMTMDVTDQSNGDLDMSILPVVKLWDIGGEHPRIPTQKELNEALLHVGSKKVELIERDQKQYIKFHDIKTEIDLGAVGKGIACDELQKIFEQEKKIYGTISVGGSIVVKGEKKNNEKWVLAVKNPRIDDQDTNQYIGTYETKEPCFMSTSGDYERYFEKDGVRYHHIINPKTGKPARSDVSSVTIIAKQGFLTDALSTACFIEGKEAGMKLAKKYGVQILFVDQNKKLFGTDDMKKNFKIKDEQYEWGKE